MGNSWRTGREFPPPRLVARLRAWPFLLQLVLLIALYFVTAKLGLLLAFVQTNASPVWLSAGLAIAVLIVFGPRLALGVGLGAFLVNATTGIPLWSAVAMGLGNALEAYVAYVLLKLFRFRPGLESHRDFLLLTGVAALTATVSATAGVGSLALAHNLGNELIALVWLIWWGGNVLGVITVTPVILTLAFPISPPSPNWRRRFEAAVLAVLLAATASVVFLTPYTSAMIVLAVVACLPFMLWAALRFGVRGAAAAVLGWGVLGVWGTAHGTGPFAWLSQSQASRSINLQSFIAVISISTLTLATVLSSRRQV